MLRILLILFCLIFATSIFAQRNDKLKLKPFIELQGKRAFSGNDTRYFGINFGARAKCKFKVGLSYSWLRDTYATTAFPVDQNIFPDATENTETRAQFISILVSPLVIPRKRINVSLPINVGMAILKSDYDHVNSGFIEYHSSTPFFTEIGADFDFRLARFLKFGLSVGYRKVFTDLEVAKEALDTPLFGLKLKLGRMCK